MQKAVRFCQSLAVWKQNLLDKDGRIAETLTEVSLSIEERARALTREDPALECARLEFSCKEDHYGYQGNL